ncbi:MAG: hypothetical protein CMJ64_16960 [Planctomycetaceae bacterium]|nr:hypothetical protein [Planctomycetaceae bacterium]
MMSRKLSIEQLESRITMDGTGSVTALPTPEGEGDPQPAFQLEDVNPDSPRFGESVSPRDYLSQVSAWYFGHST